MILLLTTFWDPSNEEVSELLNDMNVKSTKVQINLTKPCYLKDVE